MRKIAFLFLFTLVSCSLTSTSFAETKKRSYRPTARTTAPTRIVVVNPPPRIVVPAPIVTTATTPAAPKNYPPVEMGFLFGTSFSSHSNTETSTIKSTGEVGFGGGIMTVFNANEVFGVESGLYYAPRSLGFETTRSGKTLSFQEVFHAVEIPLMARFSIGRIFSIGLGTYASIGVGDVSVGGDNIGMDVGRDGASGYGAMGLHNFDYGLLGGVQLRIPVGQSTSLVIDSRYNFGLRDLRVNPTDDNARSLRSLRMFGGIAFSL